MGGISVSVFILDVFDQRVADIDDGLPPESPGLFHKPLRLCHCRKYDCCWYALDDRFSTATNQNATNLIHCQCVSGFERSPGLFLPDLQLFLPDIA